MNRGYTRARYLELIAELKETVPDLALSTDLIVGFPGETEEDFARTVEMVERGRLRQRVRLPLLAAAGHAGGGDARPGAGRRQGRPQHARILEAATRVGAARSRRLEGRMLPVLVDGVSRKNAREATGRTRCNRVVNFDPRGRDLLGRVVPVRVTQALPHSLAASLASREPLAPAVVEEDAPCGSR